MLSDTIESKGYKVKFKVKMKDSECNLPQFLEEKKKVKYTLP